MTQNLTDHYAFPKGGDVYPYQHQMTAVLSNPDDAWAWLQLGLVMARARQNTKARDCFAQVLRLNPALIPTDPSFADLARHTNPSLPLWLTNNQS